MQATKFGTAVGFEFKGCRRSQLSTQQGHDKGMLSWALPCVLECIQTKGLGQVLCQQVQAWLHLEGNGKGV